MRVPRGTMLYDPYTVLARRNDALQTSFSSYEIPRYVSGSASTYWSEVGSAIQAPNDKYASYLARTGEHKARPRVAVTFTDGKEYELRPIEKASMQKFTAAITDLLEESNLPALKRGDLLYIVHSNKVSAVGISAVPGTRVHIVKRKHQGLALNDVELTNGNMTINAFPATDDKFVLVVLRACGYFACNYAHNSTSSEVQGNGWVYKNHGVYGDISRVVKMPRRRANPYHDDAPTLSNLPGSNLLPNSPYVTVAW